MKNITIVGGGIAGLSAGIALRQRAVPVTVIESKDYPRHKVCGEFVSGRGFEVLGRLDIDVAKLGVPVESISFHDESKASSTLDLPHSGIGVSRFRFDLTLAQAFQKLGGHVKSSCRFQSSQWGEGFVCATGRQRDTPSRWKWYGLKAHVTNVSLRSDLELHLTDNGYVGLCRVEEGKVNVCGLFRRPARSVTRSPNLLEHFTSTRSLRERLLHANWDEHSFAAVSGLPVGRVESAQSDRMQLGDALSMIPPFTGNGMSVALESASLAVDPLVEYSRGQLSWTEAIAAFQSGTRKQFRRRLNLANAAQSLLMKSFWKRLFMRPEIIGIWRFVFSQTR